MKKFELLGGNFLVDLGATFSAQLNQLDHFHLFVRDDIDAGALVSDQWLGRGLPCCTRSSGSTCCGRLRRRLIVAERLDRLYRLVFFGFADLTGGGHGGARGLIEVLWVEVVGDFGGEGVPGGVGVQHDLVLVVRKPLGLQHFCKKRGTSEGSFHTFKF